MATVLNLIDDETLYDQYADPLGGLDAMARCYGVSAGAVYSRLATDRLAYGRAQAIKAQRLHELAVHTLYSEPERIVDAAGNERIDPSSVALLKYRSSEASRIAGILDNRLSERYTVDVTHSAATPLADMLRTIAANGSAVLPAPYTLIEDAEYSEISETD